MPAGPILVFDSNPDALARRVDLVRTVAPGAPVIGVASSTAVGVVAESLPAGTPVLLDLFATDRSTLDRPGARLLRRLARDPRAAHVRLAAWSAQPAIDVVEEVREAGAAGFVVAGRDAAAERAALLAFIDGADVWPADVPAPDESAWSAWFAERYRLAWEPWIEPVLVRLAAGRERTAAVPELLELDAAQSPGQAVGRLRRVARAIAGEHRNSSTAVAQAASRALSFLAAHRPLRERPPVTVSLEQASLLARSAPSLLRAARLTDDEIEEVLAIDSLISERRTVDATTVGAPPADLVRSERFWAAGRRAVAQGASRKDVEVVVQGILARLDAALIALDDARDDEPYHPEARAAAALSLVEPEWAGDVPGVSADDGVPRWRGLDAASVAQAGDVPVAELRALWTAVDGRFALAR